jgi:hypothetical protein
MNPLLNSDPTSCAERAEGFSVKAEDTAPMAARYVQNDSFFIHVRVGGRSKMDTIDTVG